MSIKLEIFETQRWLCNYFNSAIDLCVQTSMCALYLRTVLSGLPGLSFLLLAFLFFIIGLLTMVASFVITSRVTVSLGALASTKGQTVDSASHDMFLQRELASLHTSSKNTELKTIPVHYARLPREIFFPYLVCVSISQMLLNHRLKNYI